MQLNELLTILSKTVASHEKQEELRYHDAYIQIEAEFKKLGSLYNEKPDYVVVIKQATTLLQLGCKHLFVYTALAYAMCQVYQWPGFVAGIELINTQLNDHWSTLFPSTERLRGRIAPLQGLVDRWQKWLTNRPLQSLNTETLNTLIASLKTFDTLCTQHFNDQINVLSLLSLFQEQQQRLEQDRSQREAQQKADAERQQQEAEQQAASAALLAELDARAEAVSPDQLLENMNTQQLHDLACTRLLKERMELMQNDCFNYAFYKHNRAEMWWRQPYSESELLELIDQQGLNWEGYCAALLVKAKGQHQQALILFETLAHQHSFFLELQLHICDCLQALNKDDSMPIIELLKNEVQQLCRVYPVLEDAKINREINIVEPRTRQYFEVFQL